MSVFYDLARFFIAGERGAVSPVVLCVRKYRLLLHFLEPDLLTEVVVRKALAQVCPDTSTTRRVAILRKSYNVSRETLRKCYVSRETLNTR
jgi:hypothetical protein